MRVPNLVAIGPQAATWIRPEGYTHRQTDRQTDRHTHTILYRSVADPGGARGPGPPPFGKVKNPKRAPLTENDVLRSRKRKILRPGPPPFGKLKKEKRAPLTKNDLLRARKRVHEKSLLLPSPPPPLNFIGFLR